MERKYFGRFGSKVIRIWNDGEFLADIRKEFGGEDKEIVKVAELKRLEQEEKTMEELYRNSEK